MKMSKLLALALVLLISVGTLAGSTIAWFTDEVTSANNLIQAGNLELEVAVQSTEDAGFVALSDDKPDAVFDYELWEPGYVATRGVQIKNTGSLTLKYQMFINPNNAAEVSKLANVIDVYSNSAWPTSRTELGNCLGTLAEIINGTVTIEGKLAAGTAGDTRYLSLKMQESAGNEYQGLTIGTFDLQVLATQDTVEPDSFDNQYDAEASWDDSLWDGAIPETKPDSLVVDTTKKLISINDAEGFAYLNSLVADDEFYDKYGSKWQYTIELNADINLLNKEWKPFNLSSFVAFEGNGHTIRNLKVSGNSNGAGLFGSVTDNDKGHTYIRNFTLDGAIVSGNEMVGAIVGNSKQGFVENVTVNNATITGIKYVGGIFGWGNGSVNNCTVKNSTITIPADGNKEAGGLIGYVSNDGLATTDNKVIANNTVENVTIMAPNIAAGLVAQPNSSNTGGAVIDIRDNKLKNVTIATGASAEHKAALYVSYDVTGKTKYENNNNTAEVCTTLTYAQVNSADSLANALNTTDVIVLTDNIAMGGTTLTIAGEKTIDLNGKTLSGTCNSGQAHLFMVNNGATLNIKDSGKDGKITYAQGSSNVGWAIDLEGALNLYSGTIELTGDEWSIGYAVDVRPNAWGTAYTNPTVFNMKGGKIVSSDGAVRVASSSSDTYKDVSAVFNMSGGEIDAAFDGIFIQQSNAAYDTLTVNLKGGKIVSSGLAPIRFYGPVATSVNSGAEKPMTLVVDGCNLVKTEDFDTTRTWYVDGKIVLGGGMTLDTLNQYTSITIK